MYDTTNFWVSAKRVGDCTPTLNALEDISRTLYNDRKRYYIHGRLQNYDVFLGDAGVSVKGGSLCKWQLGNNYEPLTRQGAEDAVTSLSDALHLPLAEAKVTRLDFGACFVLHEPTNVYLEQLGALQDAERTKDRTSLYYHSAKGVLCLYDKNAETISHSGTIPKQYQNKNVLRYEQRLMYPTQINTAFQTAVAGATLYNANFFAKVVELWKSKYNEIEKLTNVKAKEIVTTMNTKEFQAYCVARTVAQMGGLENMLNVISESQAQKQITRFEARRKRDYLKKMCSISVLKSGTPKQCELLQKINEYAKQ
mgnify:CR=1 FL=1